MLGGLILLAVAFLAVFVWAYRYRNDAFLAQAINRGANRSLRGRLELGRVHWGVRALLDLAMGTPTPVEIDRFAVYDPRGNEIIFAPRVRGRVELWPLVTDGALIVHDMVVPRGRCRVVEQRFGGGPREIGLVAAFSPVKPNGGRGFRVELLNFDFGAVDLLLSFPDWSLHLPAVQSGGSFVLTGGKPSVDGVRYNLQPRAASGVLTIKGVAIPLRNLRAHRFEAWPPRPLDLLSGFTVDAGGAEVHAEGWLLGIYSPGPRIDMAVKVKGAQAITARLLGQAAAGPGWLEGRAAGPLARPLMVGRVGDVALGSGSLRASGLKGRVVLDAAKTRVGATEVVGQLLGGRVAGAAGLNLVTGNWSVRADLKDVEAGGLHPSLAGKLGGRLRIRGTTRPLPSAGLEVAAELVRPRRDWIPRRLRLGGTAFLNPPMLDLAGFSVEGEGQRVVARGSVNLFTRAVNMYLGADAARLGAWLASRGLPDVAGSAKASLHLSGRWPDLRATGPAEARGVGYQMLRLPIVRGQLELARGALYLRRARAYGLGGRLTGQARLEIFDGRLDRPRRKPVLQASVAAQGLDLAALGGGHKVVGRVDGTVEISGPLDQVGGRASLRLPSVAVLGDRFEGSTAQLGLLRDRLTIYRALLPRSGGGRLELWGDLFFNRRMDLRASVSAFPVASIPGVPGQRLGLGGELSGTLHGTGSLADPRLEGRLAVCKAKLRGMELGSGEVSFTPSPDDVRVRGHLLGNTIRLDGVLLARPRPTARLTLEVTRFPLEKMVRELRMLGEVRSAIDGRVQLHVDSGAGLTWGLAKLSRAEVSLLYTPRGERRVRRIELSAASGITANYDGTTLHLEPARLVSRVEGQSQNRAELTVGGTVSSGGPDLRLRGRVAVALAEFFLAQWLKQAQGYANTDVHLGGRFGDLGLDGRIDLGDVRLKVAGYGRDIRIRGGSLRFDPGRIQLSGVELELERALLAASGGLTLKQFRPDRANLRLSGDLNMRLLQIFFPRQFSHATGTAAISLSVNGPVRDPQLTGRLKVKHVELSPRGLGRTIALSSGEVDFSNYLVKTARPLEGTYDEGNLRVSGEVRLDRWEPVDVFLKIAGVGIPQRQPNVYTAEANLDLTLLGDSAQLTLKGDVDLVDARYVRPFDVVKQAFIRPRVFEEETPFWKGTPLLENLQLRLNVQSTGQLSVKNDYASLSLSGALAISGTLAAPRLGGQIRVEEGNFRIPFLRGDYTISRGEVSFNERRAADSAEINISGETIFPDRNGVEYQIRLTLQGPLNGIKIQLSSTPSLDQGQILALLATGRTTDQLRKQLRSTSESGGQAAGVADAQVKQLTGEILSNIIEEPLKRVTRLDVARLEVGTESAQLRVCKKLGRYANLCGDYEYGMLGDTRAEGRMEIKISDLLMLVGKLERFTTRLEVETVDPQRGRGELKLRLPIR